MERTERQCTGVNSLELKRGQSTVGEQGGRGAHLVEVKDEIELAHIAEITIENLRGTQGVSTKGPQQQKCSMTLRTSTKWCIVSKTISSLSSSSTHARKYKDAYLQTNPSRNQPWPPTHAHAARVEGRAAARSALQGTLSHQAHVSCLTALMHAVALGWLAGGLRTVCR